MFETSHSVDESAQSETEPEPFLLIWRGVAIIESSADVTSGILF